MAGSKPGRESKGPRIPAMVRTPDTQYAHYKNEADALGLDLSDYYVYVMALHHDLPMPHYIQDRIDPAQYKLGA